MITTSPARKQYQSGTAYDMPGKYWDALMGVAVDNGGYVTPALVAPHGVPAVELRKMVSRGTLHAAARGVYRIPSLPYDPLDDAGKAHKNGYLRADDIVIESPRRRVNHDEHPHRLHSPGEHPAARAASIGPAGHDIDHQPLDRVVVRCDHRVVVQARQGPGHLVRGRPARRLVSHWGLSFWSPSAATSLGRPQPRDQGPTAASTSKSPDTTLSRTLA